MNEKITMTRKELQRVAILDHAKNKVITCTEAAIRLSVSLRQFFRILRRYSLDGPKGIVHRSRGKPSNHRIDQTIEHKILELLRTKYVGHGPVLACEHLEKYEHLRVSREYIRSLMMKNGLWQKSRKRRPGRRWRQRKDHFGELLQLDGSEHKWFFGIDKLFTLIAFIDDATGTFMYGMFCSGESTENLMIASRECFLKHGKPVELYTDRGSVYKVNNGNLNDDLCTQYERMLNEIGVKLTHANSPQAKGRIERLFKTLQDRLVKELKLANITTIESANDYLINVFIPEFNERFTVVPTKEHNLHTPITEAKLDHAMCIVSERIVTNDWTVRYENKILQLDHTRPAIVKPKDRVIIHQKLSGELYVTIRRENIKFKEITKNDRNKKPTSIRIHTTHKPAKDHPWRRAFTTPKINTYVSQI
jgi:hypothetical protein